MATTGTAIVSRSASEVALRACNEPLLKLRQEIQQLILDGHRNNIMQNYAIGELIKLADSNSEMYGEGALGRLTASLDISPAILYSCHALATTFTRGGIVKMLKKRMKNGNTLTFGHLLELSKLRQEFRERVPEVLKLTWSNNWTVEALAGEIQQILGRRLDDKLSKRGRKPSVPRTAAAGITQIWRLSEGFCKRQEGFECAVFDSLREISATECTPQLASNIRQAVVAQAQLGDVVKHNVVSLTESLARIEKILKSKSAKGEEQVDTDDELVAVRKSQPPIKTKKKKPVKAKRQKQSRRLSKVRPNRG
jgi:hypothetical protein